ncbi:hypothetical protein U9M48_013937 [Paspalum notatum var. saurae]|uniref:Protein FAR1-RELATED SEQUENCE n=1 Tax=Paspalum notatum var. saurae TaxID=547442 RepID=A0AAQ3T366_PASNO
MLAFLSHVRADFLYPARAAFLLPHLCRLPVPRPHRLPRPRRLPLPRLRRLPLLRPCRLPPTMTTTKKGVCTILGSSRKEEIDLNAEPLEDWILDPPGGLQVEPLESGGLTVPTAQTSFAGVDVEDGIEVLSTPKEPHVGLTFETWERAQAYYNEYARHAGFSIRIDTSKGSKRENEKRKYMFVCQKAGVNKKVKATDDGPITEKKVVRTRRHDYVERTRCPARMIVRKMEHGHCQVVHFSKDHNHECVKKFSLTKYLASHRSIPPEEEGFIKFLHGCYITTTQEFQIMSELYGGIENCPYTEGDTKNLRFEYRAEYRGKDVKATLEYFEELKKEDPKFYYIYSLDEFDRVENLFWVDGEAKKAYELYNDCISFDTIFLTNAYNMPCAPIIATCGNIINNKKDFFYVIVEIDRNGLTIQLSCCFLRNEKTAAFVWLFTEFKKAMGGRAPVNIITDQNLAMEAAIAEIQQRIFSKKYENEATTVVKVPHYLTEHPMEVQMKEAYTRKLFNVFQNELQLSSSYYVVRVQGDELIDVVPYGTCPDKLYGSRTFRVFDALAVHEVTARYILARWSVEKMDDAENKEVAAGPLQAKEITEQDLTGGSKDPPVTKRQWRPRTKRYDGLKLRAKKKKEADNARPLPYWGSRDPSPPFLFHRTRRPLPPFLSISSIPCPLGLGLGRPLAITLTHRELDQRLRSPAAFPLFPSNHVSSHLLPSPHLARRARLVVRVCLQALCGPRAKWRWATQGMRGWAALKVRGLGGAGPRGAQEAGLREKRGGRGIFTTCSTEKL